MPARQVRDIVKSACIFCGLAIAASAGILLSGCGEGHADRENRIHLRLNCGGPDVGSPGKTDFWANDERYVEGGRAFRFSGKQDLAGVEEPAPDAVYRTVRRSNHIYFFPDLPDGKYTVRLHFIDGGRSTSRAMDYTIADVKVLNGFNIKQAAGGVNRAVVKEFVTEAKSGLRILASQDDGVDVFQAGIEIIGGAERALSEAAQEPVRSTNKSYKTSGSRSSVPDDLAWLRGNCGEGALAYSADKKIYLVEVGTGETEQVGNGRFVEFSPDSSKLAWIDGSVAKGRMRKGDQIVRDIATGIVSTGALHWINDQEIAVVCDHEGKTGWHQISLDGRRVRPIPELDALGLGALETDIKRCEDGVWSYVTRNLWKTTEGESGPIGRGCSTSLSPDGKSMTVLQPRHKLCELRSIREGGASGDLRWIFEDGFDNHRWSSNDPRFFVCVEEENNHMVVMMLGKEYCTRMGVPGRDPRKMYGDFTVGSGDGDPWPTE